jgi:hypothetical protein
LPVEWSAGKSMSSIANSLLPRVKSEFWSIGRSPALALIFNIESYVENL